MKFPLVSRAWAAREIRGYSAALEQLEHSGEHAQNAIALTRKIIREIADRHKPSPGEWARLGNSIGGNTEWWCQGCHKPWPCRDWREMRRLYSATHGTESDLMPPQSITMQPAAPAKQTVLGVNG
ncbi:hypothetical protein ACI3EY_16515 [Ornithinimicrobium sp. LYQ92]|uniref:hypothetical protein n=1 Tax=Serinicoccus sp. LYQ92 TaxID=3378798 RepID=UPI003853561A